MDQTQLWKTQNMYYAVHQGMRKDKYHNPDHAREFAITAGFLARIEGVDDNGIFIVTNVGVIHDYDKDEYESLRKVTPMMRDLGYTLPEIAEIGRVSLATIVGAEPKDILEEIVQDADRANMGRFDFLVTSDCLKEELCVPYGCIDRRKWAEHQLGILKQVRYRTKTAQELYGPGLKYNIELLEGILK